MKKIVSVMMLTLALGAFAFSQAGVGGGGGGGGRGQRGGGGGGAQYARAGVQYGLLGHADVATALKVTDDQKTKLTAAADARTAAMTAARDAGGDQATTAAARTKAGQDYSTAVGGILTADQKNQLLDIFVVVAKNQALVNPDVQTALSLGADEQTKIKELVTAEGKASASIRQQQTDGTMDAAAAGAARTKNAETLGNDLLAALTDAHRSAFAKMASDANFTPDPAVRNYLGGGGRRGGGGGGGGN